MAIQSRRGPYNKFDTQKMLPGEWAVVLEGDTNAVDGMAAYMCFKAGVVKRMATYEDMVDNIRESSGEIIAAQIETAVSGAIKACETAASKANTSKTNADTAAKNANTATTAANKSKADADAAAQRANEAAEACEGIKDNTRITALENEMAQMQIGGTNLLHKTRDMSGYGISSNVTLSKDSEGFTVASFASVSTLAWNPVRVRPPIQFSAVRGKTVTVSLEVRSADYVQLNADRTHGLNISFDLCSASSLVRAKYKAIAKYTEDLSEDWKKITVTATLSDEFFSEGTGTIDDTTRVFLQVYNYSVYRMEIRKLKLEVGTKVTDWSPAPEDTDAAIAAMEKAVLLAAHPVGSIYTSINDTNPEELFGGTWEQINDVFLLASGKRNAGETGGEEEVTLTTGQMPTHTHTGPSHTHTLASHAHTATSASAGAHTHNVDRNKNAASGSDRYAAQYASEGTTTTTSSAGAHSHTITVNGSGQLTTGAAGTGNTGSAGSGKAHNNMPPYKVVNVWIRVA